MQNEKKVNIMSGKKCSGCKYFTKFNITNFGGGICDLMDWRTNEDVKKCNHFKKKSYNRLMQKNLFLREFEN